MVVCQPGPWFLCFPNPYWDLGRINGSIAETAESISWKYKGPSLEIFKPIVMVVRQRFMPLSFRSGPPKVGSVISCHAQHIKDRWRISLWKSVESLNTVIACRLLWWKGEPMLWRSFYFLLPIISFGLQVLVQQTLDIRGFFKQCHSRECGSVVLIFPSLGLRETQVYGCEIPPPLIPVSGLPWKLKAKAHPTFQGHRPHALTLALV